MKRKFAVLLALPAMPCAAAKIATPPPILDPVGPWDVHANENACMLGRAYGSGDQRILVAFQPMFNASTGEVFVMSTLKSGNGARGKAVLTAEPSGRAVVGSYFSATLPKGELGTRITIDRGVWEGLGDTDVLSISAPPVKARIKLVRFAAAKPVFDECERKTLSEWGVDPAVLDPARAPVPVRPAERYYTADDYPSEAIANGHVGRVIAILNIDATGAVTGCRIGSGSWPDLNKATCDPAHLMRFEPGRDASGRPIPSVYILPVRWTTQPGF